MMSGVSCITAAGAAHIGSVLTQEIHYFAQECNNKAILRVLHCTIISLTHPNIILLDILRQHGTTIAWIAASF